MSGRTDSRAPVILLLGGIAAGAVMALAVLSAGPRSAPAPGQTALPTAIPDRVIVGEPAPDFSASTQAGGVIRLSSLYRDTPVAVNFWATWCGPCRVEMPALQQAFAAGQINVVAVNAGEQPEVVSAYMQELGLTFPAALDPDGSIIALYGIRVFPTTVILDSRGIVRAEHLGPLTPDLIDRYVAASES